MSPEERRQVPEEIKAKDDVSSQLEDVVTCMTCQSAEVAVILYGEPNPSPELYRALAQGRIVLGGCVIDADDPLLCCRACGEFFARRGQVRPHEERYIRRSFREAFRRFWN